MGSNFKKDLGLNVLSAIHGMSTIWDVSYWEVSLYTNEKNTHEKYANEKYVDEKYKNGSNTIG